MPFRYRSAGEIHQIKQAVSFGSQHASLANPFRNLGSQDEVLDDGGVGVNFPLWSLQAPTDSEIVQFLQFKKIWTAEKLNRVYLKDIFYFYLPGSETVLSFLRVFCPTIDPTIRDYSFHFCVDDVCR